MSNSRRPHIDDESMPTEVAGNSLTLLLPLHIFNAKNSFDSHKQLIYYKVVRNFNQRLIK